MKQTAPIIIAILSCFCTTALASFPISDGFRSRYDFDDDLDYYSDRYYDYDDGDIYRLGFNINNYAADYTDYFIQDVAREYGIRKSQLRECIRLGFSPSDILFGAELARRSGRSFASVMNLYRTSDHKNWINISINIGIPFGSPGFGLIIDSFRNHYRFWNDYYARRHPHRRPPVYNHDWSYFRPCPPGVRPHRRPPLPDRRPARPGIHPGDHRPAVPGRPQRPSTPQRPDRPQRPAPSERPTRPGYDNGQRPPKNSDYRRNSPAKNNGADRRERPQKNRTEDRSGSYRR